MKFSIISVCYNDKAGLLDTMESVFRQSFLDLEYIVVDGGSTDGTAEMLPDAQKKFAAKNIPFRYISERDKGIYNAMNKGIDMAFGEWAIFLNAGDYLCGPKVLEKVAGKVEAGADAIYGDVVIKNGELVQYSSAPRELKLDATMPYCHQCVFVKTDLLKQYRFDETIKISSDHDQFLRMYLDHRKFQYLEMPISVFLLGGLSSTEEGYRRLLIDGIELLEKYRIITAEESLRRRDALSPVNSYANRIKRAAKSNKLLYKLILRIKGWKSAKQWAWIGNGQ